MNWIRTTVLAFACAIAAAANAFTFSVTSPTSGTIPNPNFLGSTNTVKFNVTEALREMTIRVIATNTDTNTTVSREDRFSPNVDNKIDASLPLNFSQGTPEGNYRIDVLARYSDDSTTTTITLDNLKLDITKPKVLDFNPINNAFVGGGIRTIRALVQEANFKEYRVQVNGQDIPDNTGVTLVANELTVNWDTSGIVNDGTQTISINIKDKANNEFTQTLSVTVDRVKPSITISSPRTATTVRARSEFNVVVDIVDFNSSSVNVTGVDVILTKMDNTFLYRVPRVSYSTGATNRWTGRVNGKNVNLPSQFKVKATAVDRAGNIGVTQTATITVN